MATIAGVGDATAFLRRPKARAAALAGWDRAIAAVDDRGRDTTAGIRTPWTDLARPDQLPPAGDWLTWLILAGRGYGKTRTGAETLADLGRRHPGSRTALVATTFADGRDTMVEGESGLLECLDDAELRGQSRDTAWNRSMGELFLANGSRYKIYSSERPRQLRGPQHHFAWGDEFCQWLDAPRGTGADTTWSNLLFGLRLAARDGWPGGYRPRVVLTSTPRPVQLLKVPESVLTREPHRAGIIQRPDTTVTRGSTSENLANLADAYRRAVIDPLVGTSLGRQELDAEILEDIEGAYLSRELVDRARIIPGEMPQLPVIAVAVDPAETAKASSDETGIVVVGADQHGHGYVLDDYSLRGTPDEWGRTVWRAVLDNGASLVVVEDNAGGDMVTHVLATTWDLVVRERRARGVQTPAQPAIVRVHPSGKGQGKWMRSIPVKGLYEQGRMHHLRDPKRPDRLDELEDQATSWTNDPGQDSPDRVDAAVHGLTWLLFPRQRAERHGRLEPVGGRAVAGGRR